MHAKISRYIAKNKNPNFLKNAKKNLIERYPTISEVTNPIRKV